MTYEELRVQLDINDPVSVLDVIGKLYADSKWFVVCNDGDCHLFDSNGNECNIREVIEIDMGIIPKDIKKIVIPDSVVRIENYAFAWCRGLESMTIPNNVTNIGCYAFALCRSLANVMIPNSVKSIREDAFYGCDQLEDIVFKGKTLEEVKQMDNYPWRIEDESIIRCIE